MSEANVEIFRSAWEAFNEDGTEAFIAYCHPDIEFTTPSDLASEPDTYKGHEGLRRYWDSFFEIMEEIKVEPLVVHDWGDEVVVAETLLKARGQATGLEVEQRAAMVVAVADNKAIRTSFHPTLEEAEAVAESWGGTRPV